jgi:dTDP-glucose pyrophosphorylase
MKKNLNIVNKTISILDAMKILEKSTIKIICYINNSKKLIGIINDGDIRRSILRGFSLNQSIKDILNYNPITINSSASDEDVQNLMLKKKINFIPILKKNVLYNIKSLEIFRKVKIPEIDVIIMAGGYGKRLLPITKKTPKTLINITPKLKIIDIILQKLIKSNLIKISFITFYKKLEIIKYVKKKYKNYNFNFISEKKKMGTAGGLSLLDIKKLSDYIVLMNCDIITNININDLIDFHIKNKSNLTIVTKSKNYKLKYGAIENLDLNFSDINEKPVLNFFINAGIYVIDKSLLNYMKFKKQKLIDMTEFIKIVQIKKKTIKLYHAYEDWIDVGSFEDLNHLKKIYQKKCT